MTCGTPCSVVEITGETQISGRYALMYNEGDEGQLAAKNGQPVWAYEVEAGVTFHLYKAADAWRVGRDMQSTVALGFFKRGADFLAPTAQVERMNVRGWSLYNHKDRKWSVDWGAQATCVGGVADADTDDASDATASDHDEL